MAAANAVVSDDSGMAHNKGLTGAGPCTHCNLYVASVYGLQGAVVGPRAEDIADLVALHGAHHLSRLPHSKPQQASNRGSGVPPLVHPMTT